MKTLLHLDAAAAREEWQAEYDEYLAWQEEPDTELPKDEEDD